MDPTRLAARAEGDSVTAERLTDPVVSALEDEQPHHLLEGQSLDVSGGENTERLFPSVDASVWLVATDRRVLFVVPKATAVRTESLEYDDVDAVETTDGDLPELRVAAGDLSLTLNARAGEPLGTAAASVREQAADEPTVSVDTPRTSEVDRGTSSLADGPQTDREGTTSDGDPIDQLERLADLHDRGVITEAELEQRKRQLLDRL